MMEKRINSPANAEIKAVDTSKVTKTGKAKAAKLKREAEERDAAKAAPPPVVDPKTFDFPVNCKFIMGNALYTVIKTHYDSNTEWRTVISAVNQDQDFMLDTLRKDARNDPTFVVVELGNPKERPVI